MVWVALTRPFCPGHRRAGRTALARTSATVRSRAPGGPPGRPPGRPPRRPPFLPPSRIGRHTASGTGTPLGARPPRASTVASPGATFAVCAWAPAPSTMRVTILRWCGQRDHDDRALLTGAGRATGAVEVVLVVGRRVDLHDHADVVDVDAARGDVGGDEHVHRAVPEGAEHAVAHGLREAAVQRCREHAAVAQLAGDAVGAELGAGEDDDASAAAGELGGEGLLVLRVDEQHVVAHRRDRGLGLVGRVRDRVDEVALDEGVDALVEGRREEQPLAARRGPRRGSR